MGATSEIADWIREKVGVWRATVILFAVFLFVSGGVWLFYTPEYETMYGCSILPFTHADGTRTMICAVNIGNTGRKAQSVDLALRPDALQRAILKPTLRNFGVRQRRMRRSEHEDRIVFHLGEVAPEMEVEFKFVLSIPPGETPPGWDDLLIGVKPEHGPAIRGSPGMTKYLRVIYSIFG